MPSTRFLSNNIHSRTVKQYNNENTCLACCLFRFEFAHSIWFPKAHQSDRYISTESSINPECFKTPKKKMLFPYLFVYIRQHRFLAPVLILSKPKVEKINFCSKTRSYLMNLAATDRIALTYITLYLLLFKFFTNLSHSTCVHALMAFHDALKST